MAAQIAANTLEGRALALASRIENLQLQIEDEQDRCKEQCAPMREDISEIWKEAKKGAMPVKAMRAYVKLRGVHRKTMKKLDPSDQVIYDRLRESLGPLGAAAADRAEALKGATVTFKDGTTGAFETPF